MVPRSTRVHGRRGRTARRSPPRARPVRTPRRTPREVLFVCVENAARSLMAEAIFNALAPEGWRARSAGTRPAAAPNPRTGPMLGEIGLRLPPHPPRRLTPTMMGRAARVVTMGCIDTSACPAVRFPERTVDWGLADPGPLKDDGFRAIRDRICALALALRTELRHVGKRRTPG
ncbi:MAG: arsenate-mycothiol transferase ArsC [Thermoplasmata archaeon]